MEDIHHIIYKKTFANYKNKNNQKALFKNNEYTNNIFGSIKEKHGEEAEVK